MHRVGEIQVVSPPVFDVVGKREPVRFMCYMVIKIVFRVLSEISQVEKDQYQMVSFICGV